MQPSRNITALHDTQSTLSRSSNNHNTLTTLGTSVRESKFQRTSMMESSCSKELSCMLILLPWSDYIWVGELPACIIASTLCILVTTTTWVTTLWLKQPICFAVKAKIWTYRQKIETFAVNSFINGLRSLLYCMFNCGIGRKQQACWRYWHPTSRQPETERGTEWC